MQTTILIISIMYLCPSYSGIRLFHKLNDWPVNLCVFLFPILCVYISFVCIWYISLYWARMKCTYDHSLNVFTSRHLCYKRGNLRICPSACPSRCVTISTKTGLGLW